MDALVLAAFVAVLAVLAWLGLRVTGVANAQRVTRRLQCPAFDRPAHCILVRDLRTGKWVGVEHCALRAGSRGCEAECVRLLELGDTLAPREPEGWLSKAGDQD